ncbi:MAG: hypothetical protein IJH64_04610 [Oscillospiraceae bacterium]|nr:hypothetical protein [Oscillospiraceae bacterium]
MDQKAIEKDMRNFIGGASFITVQQLSKYLGKSRNTTLKLLEAVPAVQGRLYFIPDVAKALSYQCISNSHKGE